MTDHGVTFGAPPQAVSPWLTLRHGGRGLVMERAAAESAKAAARSEQAEETIQS